MAKLICDFCSSDKITWDYPCEDFVVDGVGSKGDWAACDICHDMITNKEWESLAVRTYNSPRARAEWRAAAELLGRGRAIRTIKKLHLKFRAHRCGEPTPIKETV